MLGLVMLFSTAALSFGAGYAMRAARSRMRRAKYLKYEPYLQPPRTGAPPTFLFRSSTDTETPSPHPPDSAAG